MTTSKDKRRLADALADAGVGSRRVAIELLYLLPDDFVVEYETLFHRTFSLGDEGKGEANDKQAELGRSSGKGNGKEMGSRGSSGVGSRKGSVFPVKSEAALDEKQWVDRQLRKLTRAMKSGVMEKTDRYKCGQRTDRQKKEKQGCGKWNEKAWVFCPYCGNQNRMKIVNSEPGLGRTVGTQTNVRSSELTKKLD